MDDLERMQNVARDAAHDAKATVAFDRRGVGTQFGNTLGLIYVLAKVVEAQIRRIDELEGTLNVLMNR